MSFKSFYLDPKIEQAVEAMGYDQPTEIQKQAIPIILQGQDVLASAQTGTGKTAAFLLPLIQILSEKPQKTRVPRAVILSPTRELAEQIGEQFVHFTKFLNLKHVLLIGGVSQGKQTSVMQKDYDVIIATPGRLIDLIEQGKILLHQVGFLIIDEADRMLDMGFIPDIEKILKWIPKKRQSLLFSATLPAPIQKLSEKILMAPKKIFVSPPQTASGNVTQYYALSNRKSKEKMLSEFLDIEKIKLGMIFCNRKRDIPALTKLVRGYGYDVLELHGDMTQSARKEAMDAFKAGKVEIMICSDVAARGIDISEVTHVINYETPVHFEDYIHRIGRTGRAGEKGFSLTFVDDETVPAWKQIYAKNKDVLKRYAFAKMTSEKVMPEKKAPEKKMSEKLTDSKTHQTDNKKARHHSSSSQPKPNEKKTSHAPVKQPVNEGQKAGFGDDVPAFFASGS